MWKIFSKFEPSIEKTFFSIEKWKAEIFSILEVEVKEYFAEKVVVYFDNNMIFHQKRGLHINLMDALSNAEQEMLNSGLLFGKIEAYWLREEDNQTLIIYGLSEEKEYTLLNNGFKLLQRDILPMSDRMEELQFNSWKTLIFDAELVNYATGWINYTPDMHQRSTLQTEYILLNMQQKKLHMSVLETLEFQRNIKAHPSYEELYQKVLRVMPKIENSLEQEWRTGAFLSQQGKNKKQKI